MNIDSVEQEILINSSRFSFIKRVQIIDKNEEAIKVRLLIDEYFFIQIYINIATETHNFVLVLNNQRLYGRDSQDYKWHRHPYEDPNSHDFTEEGSKAISVREFLEEVQEIIEKENLL